MIDFLCFFFFSCVWFYLRFQLYNLELLTEGSCEDSQITQADARTESCSLKTDSRAPLMWTIPTKLIELRGVILVAA